MDPDQEVQQMLIQAVAVDDDAEMVDAILADNPDLLHDCEQPLLHTACSKGSKAVAQILIRHGADVLGCDSRFRRPIHCAVQARNLADRTNIVKLLLAHHERQNDLRRIMLARDKQGNTCMHTAVSAPNSSEVVAILLAHKASADVAAHPKFPHVKPPLVLATMASNIETVQLLIQSKAYVNASGSRDSFGSQSNGSEPAVPLICAAQNGWLEGIKVLVQAKAYVDARDVDGMTATHWCFQLGHRDCAKWLIEQAGASTLLRDGAGCTPLDYDPEYDQQTNGDTSAATPHSKESPNSKVTNKSDEGSFGPNFNFVGVGELSSSFDNNDAESNGRSLENGQEARSPFLASSPASASIHWQRDENEPEKVTVAGSTSLDRALRGITHEREPRAGLQLKLRRKLSPKRKVNITPGAASLIDKVRSRLAHPISFTQHAVVDAGRTAEALRVLADRRKESQEHAGSAYDSDSDGTTGGEGDDDSIDDGGDDETETAFESDASGNSTYTEDTDVQSSSEDDQHRSAKSGDASFLPPIHAASAATVSKRPLSSSRFVDATHAMVNDKQAVKLPMISMRRQKRSVSAPVQMKPPSRSAPRKSPHKSSPTQQAIAAKAFQLLASMDKPMSLAKKSPARSHASVRSKPNSTAQSRSRTNFKPKSKQKATSKPKAILKAKPKPKLKLKPHATRKSTSSATKSAAVPKSKRRLRAAVAHSRGRPTKTESPKQSVKPKPTPKTKPKPKPKPKQATPTFGVSALMQDPDILAMLGDL